MQRKADRLRVTVQLVDTTSGTLIWSATFDRTLNDIFAVEDEIAEQVTGALSARLGGLEPAPPPQVRSSNVEAYLAYLRGRTLLGRLSVGESDAAAPFSRRPLPWIRISRRPTRRYTMRACRQRICVTRIWRRIDSATVR